MKVGFISLGCSKNLIDTEMTIGILKKHNFEIVNNENDADILIINTCGFIESAKEEAINTIFEMLEYKKKKCKYIIVMGCLVQRYYDELVKEIPEVDLFLKLDEYDNIWEKIDSTISGKQKAKNQIKVDKKITNSYNMEPMPMMTKEEYLDRVVTTGKVTAYLKIGEGCSNRCTYCAIPYIRGPFVSRPMEDILEEAKLLVKKGIRELIVIAQDTTKYGIDLYGESKLSELLNKLCKIEQLHWIRFLYSYPETITDELIETVKKNDKICKYFDIPIQHISDTVLKRMNRKSDKKSIISVIEKIRKNIPEAVIRTTLIVGFPRETKENFEELLEFVKKTKFEKLGAFTYSKEEGTPASRLKEQIHPMTKKSRYNKIMEEQKQISENIIKKNIGKTVEVLIETKTFDGKYYVGRTSKDVPDIDGLVYIKIEDEKENLIDKFINCKIVDVREYDLIGKIVC